MEKVLYYKDGIADIPHHVIRDEFPDMSLPADLDEELCRSLGYVPVIKHPRPVDTETQKATPDSYVSDGYYVHGWKMVPKDAQEIDRQTKHKAVTTLKVAIKNDTEVQTFLLKTPEQQAAYINSKPTEDVLKLFAKLLTSIARREYDI